MSEKNVDQHGRWRNKTIAFRVSPEESEKIDEAVRLSGHTKQDYIVNKLLNRDVVVERSPRTYKLLKDEMTNIYKELQRISNPDECSEDFLETIQYVTEIYEQMKEDQS